ncbi:DUF3871 family protein [Algoriphagus aestuariicola]|uniref:DUF3871 family protein n=1 Tax=Algoriphagus aestuariicola TaxID=1852016 RepID=A0ABS3BJV8_9BACT|nr:DUF3871 family protein [Algoriphagus aestuariicola]MBN7799231.1 DUF3871 family protein [Algoriphagus aestuariicola]
MELLRIDQLPVRLRPNIELTSEPSSSFIEANTEAVAFKEMRDHHVIPVFLKDNEPAISHCEFVEAVSQAAQDSFSFSDFPEPRIRVSHPVKGRVYEARHKKAQDLLQHEKTIYFERMAFMITIPGIQDEISGNLLELTVGGVKAFHLDNMNACKGSPEHFKVFIGFKNRVCTNLCVSTDGVKLDMKARSTEDLYLQTMELIAGFNPVSYVRNLATFTAYELEERQFAQIIGRCRLYQFLPKSLRNEIPELLINDTQVSRIAESFYEDQNFSRQNNGAIDLWRFFNLFTGANKQSYIDKFLERGVNGFEFTEQIRRSLDSSHPDFWYLS